MSEAPKVYAAIATVMTEMAKEGISKDRRSGDGGGPKFAFRGIDDVYNALAPVLASTRLMMLPRVISRTQVERTTKNGGVMFYTTVEAEFDLVSAEDGSKHTIKTFGEAMDSSDKSTNKAMSAAFKYAAMQAFCIPTEGDNDADAATHDIAPREHRDDRPRQHQTQQQAPSGDADKWVRAQIDKFAGFDSFEKLSAHVGREAYSNLKDALKLSDPKLWQQVDDAERTATARLDDVPFA